MEAPAETQKQVDGMIFHILSEAKDKAEEINAKALQEFNIEKAKVVKSEKEKIQQEYERKVKSIDTERAIARSTAINKSRLEKIKARQDVIMQIAADSKERLRAELRDQAKTKEFITSLIVQGMLMLLEDHVQVRCRSADDALVSSCLAGAMERYSQAIVKETGAAKTCKLALDKETKLPADCLGGVVLTCQNGTIVIDNTVDSRMGLVLEQAKPTIRRLLFHGQES
mmetsp:Transcript_119083/g.344433  ORF Transcript_119083/g.344433 Transcript_119083/m.344433 type:complete len:227 (+) Transcript_119083:110-790(+)